MAYSIHIANEIYSAIPVLRLKDRWFQFMREVFGILTSIREKRTFFSFQSILRIAFENNITI